MTKENIMEEEIRLEPSTELFEEAKEIAEKTTTDEKFSFEIQYDENNKDFFLSILKTLDAEVEAEDDESHALNVRMNMKQLKLIKGLDCVKRVKSDEAMYEMVANEVANAAPANKSAEAHTENAMELADNVTGLAGSVAVMSAPTNTTMASAQTITVNTSVSGRICCPGSEQWFKFTVSKKGKYTIYTTGSLDTVGYLYDQCGQELAHVDNHDLCGKLNFRIIETLDANVTYYIRVTEAKSNTGYYTLKVTDKILVDYITVNPSKIILELGKTYELPMQPNTFANVGADILDVLSASTNPADADEKKVMWSSVDYDVIKITTGWYNEKRYQTLTVVGEGTAELYAYDWNGTGKRAMCTIVAPPKAPVVTVISCSPAGWIKSSNKMGSDMAEAFESEEDPAITTPANTSDFETCWNKAGDCIIIHTHGDSYGLYNQDDATKTTPLIVSKDDIKGLPINKNIYFIMMTACETAGGTPNDNMAYWLSKRISNNGIVIANTEIVEGEDTDFHGSSKSNTWKMYNNGSIVGMELPVDLNMKTAYKYYESYQLLLGALPGILHGVLTDP